MILLLVCSFSLVYQLMDQFSCLLLLLPSFFFSLRFLQIVASADLVNSSKLIEGEMSQLKEARKFHLSLYTQVILEPFHD